MNEKELTWKYFKEQKKEELNNFFKSIKDVLFIIGALSIFVLAIFSAISILIFLFGIFAFDDIVENGYTYWYYAGMVLLPLSIIAGIIYWLRSNWIKAKQRAEKELKCKH